MEEITLNGDYGFTQIRHENLSNTLIDASGARWIVANTGSNTNRYPVLVTDSSNIVLDGGRIVGQVSLTTDWTTTYINSAAVFARDSNNVLFKDWRISNAWDGIRIIGQDNATFAVDNVWLSNIRDDGIENDRGLSGTISNSLFDGVFVGISLYEGNTGNQTDQTVTLDNVLMRMESFRYKDEMTHQPFFKYEDGVSPKLSIHDSVFAIDRVDHRELGRLEDVWDNVTDASNNFFLNLSNDPLPSSYPLPGSGFTVLEGAEAWAYWNSVRNEFVANYSGTPQPNTDAPQPASTPAPSPNPQPEPESNPVPTPSSSTPTPTPSSPTPTPTPSSPTPAPTPSSPTPTPSSPAPQPAPAQPTSTADAGTIAEVEALKDDISDVLDEFMFL